MATYLLLRNNKQSGPLSKEELIELGIKPYDLVWVENRSAAWRYPGELPEFKEHAPLVEEQPYDRFFKKKTDEKPVEKSEEKPVEKPYEKRLEKVIALESKNGNVSVIMPKPPAVSKPLVASKPTQHVASVVHETAMDEMEAKYSIPEKKEPVYAKAKTENTWSDDATEVETKYSLPLDEIKDRYVKQLEQRKHKTAQQKMIMQTMKKVAVFVAIIGSGVLIGFAIKPRNSVNKEVVTQPAHRETPVTTQPAQQETSSTNDSIAGVTATTLPSANLDEQKAEKKIVVAEKKNTSEDNNTSIDPETKSPSTVSSNGERNKAVRNVSDNEPVEKNTGSSADISAAVSVKANKYKLRDFGGFRNLELTVTNDSRVALDHVMVEVRYQKLNDETIKTEYVSFSSIAAGESLTVKVPDNNRGAKLTYRITRIESKDGNAKL